MSLVFFFIILSFLVGAQKCAPFLSIMKVKIACPHNVVTGGIELLHQTAAELNKYHRTEIWYQDRNEHSIPVEYERYNNTVNNIIEPDDVLIFPEIWANGTNDPRYKGNIKAVFWCGVNAYFTHNSKESWFKIGDVIHLSQSEYSTRFVLDVLKADRVIEVTDYINDDFLHCEIYGKRDRIVLYNPAKGMEFTEKIIAFAPDIAFIPVTGMTRKEIINLMKRSMVWIDFGDFPGKDRLPREAAACGMCLITGKRGTARYFKDLSIPDRYKIDNINYSDLQFIVDEIKDIFNHFDERQEMFWAYRERLKQEKEQFKEGIKKLSEVLDYHSRL